MNTMQYAHKLYAMMKAHNVQRGVATIYKIAFKACLKTAQAKAKELSLVKELVCLPIAVKPVVKPVAKEKAGTNTKGSVSLINPVSVMVVLNMLIIPVAAIYFSDIIGADWTHSERTQFNLRMLILWPIFGTIVGMALFALFYKIKEMVYQMLHHKEEMTAQPNTL